MDSKKIGKFISDLRKEKNMTQEDLANKLSTVRETVSKWERGVYIPPTETLLELQELFNVSINEIIYGERRNNDNEEKIDIVPINIMNDGKKKNQKIFIISTIIIILLISIFFVYYFINNYNSIHVYKISGDNEGISLNDGIMIISREKSYIQLGSINNYTNNSITSISLYYTKEDKQFEIFCDYGDKTNHLLINDFNYNELFKYEDIEFVKKNLFLRIVFDNNTLIEVKLNLKKDFANNNIFNSNEAVISIGDNKIDEDRVPKYIRDNFIKDNDVYYRNKLESNMRINQKYIVESNLYIIEEIDNNSINHFEYFIDDDSLIYYKIRDNNMYDDFTYNIENDNCIYGKCNIKIINLFKEKYLKLIRENGLN